jgi:hypothetical protein
MLVSGAWRLFQYACGIIGRMKSFRFSLATLFLAMTALCIVLAHPLGAIVFLIAFPPIFILSILFVFIHS